MSEQASVNLANALLAKKDISGATATARNAVRLAPRDSESHRALGRALSVSGDLPQAASEIKRAIELDPARADLHDDLGSIFAQNQLLTTHKPSFARRWNSTATTSLQIST